MARGGGARAGKIPLVGDAPALAVRRPAPSRGRRGPRRFDPMMTVVPGAVSDDHWTERAGTPARAYDLAGYMPVALFTAGRRRVSHAERGVRNRAGERANRYANLPAVS